MDDEGVRQRISSAAVDGAGRFAAASVIDRLDAAYARVLATRLAVR
jgi:hypothetical protein